MAVLHADLVRPLPEGWNSQNQRGFQYILSIVDSATRYLWLLRLQQPSLTKSYPQSLSYSPF